MKFAAFLLAGVGIGLGAAFLNGHERADQRPELAAAETGRPVEQRLAELETALRLERFERETLEQQLADLEAALAGLQTDEAIDDAAAANRRDRLAAAAESDGGPQRFREALAAEFRARGGVLDEAEREQRQVDRFVEAGLTAERARWIVDRQDELEMQALEARYQASQDGASAADIANLPSPTQLMRAELGDADYEKYLAGLGRPTSIAVREVLSSSPAANAGLMAGDRIVGYAGQRVFDMSELNGLTFEGRPGEPVAIDVIRDGQQIQLFVERGPIGISGGGRSIRRRP